MSGGAIAIGSPGWRRKQHASLVIGTRSILIKIRKQDNFCIGGVAVVGAMMLWGEAVGE
jgi:hypothetical protein